MEKVFFFALITIIFPSKSWDKLFFLNLSFYKYLHREKKIEKNVITRIRATFGTKKVKRYRP